MFVDHCVGQGVDWAGFDGGAVFGGATRGVFGVALYHYVAEDRTVGPFTEADLASTASRG